MNINLNEFAQEVHANAIAHGWWGEEYTDAAAIALIHAEISEALEEWRANRPMLWHQCEVHDQKQPCEKEKCRLWFNGKCLEGRDGRKPEGIAIELIDVVLRILDTAVAWSFKLMDDYWIEPDPAKLAHHRRKKTNDIIESYTLPELVCELHRLLEELRFQREMNGDTNYMGLLMSQMIGLIFAWLRAYDIDAEALMREKHEYNKTRSFKHGGKRV